MFGDVFVCLVILLSVTYSEVYSNDKNPYNLPFEIGSRQGIGLHRAADEIAPETLSKIMQGVENGDRDNIYFYGLLKLYGISLSQDVNIAATNFLRAATLGHREATTAFGVSLLYGYGIEKDTIAAEKWFRKGILLGDMVW